MKAPLAIRWCATLVATACVALPVASTAHGSYAASRPGFTGGRTSSGTPARPADKYGCHTVKLISAAHLDGFHYKPRIDKELLAQHCSGLIGMSGCLKGEIAARWRLLTNLR